MIYRIGKDFLDVVVTYFHFERGIKKLWNICSKKIPNYKIYLKNMLLLVLNVRTFVSFLD